MFGGRAASSGTLRPGSPGGGARRRARPALQTGSERHVEVSGAAGLSTVFLEVFPRQPTLVMFGGVHIAVALVPLAKALGYRTVVADGREAFLGRERFPDADELMLAWPEEAFARVGLDAATYVCVLSHDPKFDEPALEIALRSPAAYVGAIGSRKTQALRRERLSAGGVQPRRSLPGSAGRSGSTSAAGNRPRPRLAILAEMTAVRYGGTGEPLGGNA